MDGQKHAEVTEKRKLKAQHTRLTLEQFSVVFEKAPEVADWLQDAIPLALVSGKVRSNVERRKISWMNGPVAVVKRSKTEVSIAIPLNFRMNAIGMSLADVRTEQDTRLKCSG